MIEYSIRKKKPSLFHRVTGGVFEIGNPPSKSTQTQYPVVQAEPVMGPLGACFMDDADRVEATRYMDKHYFNQWLNEVQTNFKKGDLLSLRACPIIPGRKTPPFFYLVDTFQEIRHLAQWDSHHKQPRVIGMRPGEGKTGDGIYMFASPGMTRKLTAEEEALVHVHHPKIKDEIARLRGETTSEESGTSAESYAG